MPFSAVQPATYSRNPARPDPQTLARQHMPLVRRIAWHVHGRVSTAIEIEELVQIGMVALVEAANGFEDRGYAFATYASMRIRGAMIDRLRSQATICRSAMTQKRAMSGVRRKLENELGRRASESEMAEAMNLDAEEYRVLVDRCEDVQQESIDEVYSDHSLWFADVEERADDALERSALKEAITRCIGDLPEREALVLQLYFVEELNLDEIKDVLGVTAARVCQIKKAALDRLRKMLADWA